jgi:hypothetical protein
LNRLFPDQLEVIIRIDGYKDHGNVIKVSISPINLGFQTQSEYSTFPVLLAKLEEGIESYSSALVDLATQV